MKLARLMLLTLFIHAVFAHVEGQTVKGPETVVVPSGTLRLRALLWRQGGSGPFPAVLFNHGRGLKPRTEGRVEGITELGRVFAGHGYVFMAVRSWEREVFAFLDEHVKC